MARRCGRAAWAVVALTLLAVGCGATSLVGVVDGLGYAEEALDVHSNLAGQEFAGQALAMLACSSSNERCLKTERARIFREVQDLLLHKG